MMKIDFLAALKSESLLLKPYFLKISICSSNLKIRMKFTSNNAKMSIILTKFEYPKSKISK